MTEALSPLSPAELAITRQLLGLNRGQLGRMLTNRRGGTMSADALRQMEMGDTPISANVWGQVQGLLAEHDELVRTLTADGRPVQIPRVLPPDAPRPASWYHAAAARALDAEPDLMIEWE